MSLKPYSFSLIQIMNLLIFAFYLSHSRCVEDEPFIRNTINKFQSHITLFTKYATYIIIDCKMHYIGNK